MANNFTMYAGETRYLDATLNDLDLGKRLDLGGSTLTWELKQNGTIVLTKSLSNGITIIDAKKGLCEVVLSPEDTAELNGTYTYFLKEVDSYNQASVLITDVITIRQA